MSNAHRHHSIDYIEFVVNDMAAAKSFYASAFGWEFTDYGPGYAGIKGDGDGKEMGGLTVGESPGGSPLVVLYSDDLDASLASAVAAGAEITKEPFEFPGGRRFQFVDPSGNELAVWCPT